MYKFKKCVRAKRSVSTFFQQLEVLLGLQALTTLTNLAKECREIWHKDSVLFCHCAEFALCGNLRRLPRDLFPEIC